MPFLNFYKMKITIKNGLTMVEVLCATVIILVISFIIFETLIIQESSLYRSVSRGIMLREISSAMELMKKELLLTCKGTACDKDITNNNTTILFQIPVSNGVIQHDPATGRLRWGADNANGVFNPSYFIRYKVNSGKLERDILDAARIPVANTNRVLANEIENVTFACDTPTPTASNAIDINIIGRSTSKFKKSDVSRIALSATVRLRN